MPTDSWDPRAGPLHCLDYSDDINRIPKWPAGLILPNLPLQTNSIISEAKQIPHSARTFFFFLTYLKRIANSPLKNLQYAVLMHG